MGRKKQFIINLIAQMVSFCVSTGISFFLTPFINANKSSEAYGFIGLGNNFITYAVLITASLNSMAARFVTIELTKKNYDKANRYFSSVFMANVVLSAILTIPSVFIVIFLDKIFDVSANIVSDVRLLWALIFANFLIGLMFDVFGVATFATNKLYLSSIRTIVAQISRAVILIIAYRFFPIHVWYIGIAGMFVTIYSGITNCFYTKKLTPDLHIKRSYFDFAYIKEILSSGIWNSISMLGNTLLESLDLLIANLIIGKEVMGILATSKTIPSAVSQLIGTMVNIFVPSLTIDFAKNNFESLKKQIIFSMKLTGLVTSIPISILIAFGDSFYALWQPTLDPKQLQILSILTVSGFMVSGTINVIFNIFTVTNKVKFPAIVQVCSGIVNTIVVLILLEFTDLGVYAVAGVSSCVAILKNLFIIIPYASKCLNFKKTTFYPQIIKCLLAMVISMIIGSFLAKAFSISSWITFFIFAVIEMLISFGIYMAICTNKNDRQEMLNILKNVLLKIKTKV